MTTFTYHFRPSTRVGKNKGSVFMRVIHDRKPFSLSLGVHVYPEEWDSVSRTVIIPPLNSVRYAALKSVREVLDIITHQTEYILSNLESQGFYTIEDIRSQLVRRKESGMLSDFVAAVSAQICAKQARTARAYRSALSSVMEFTGGRDVVLSSINRRFVEALEAFLIDKGLHMNTVSFYMRNLRAIYNRGIKAGLIGCGLENPFLNVFTGIRKTEKKALNPAEINSLIKLDPSLLDFTFSHRACRIPTGLRDSLAMFLFAFFAQGMSFVDLVHLKKENVSNGVIKYRRKKTGQVIEVSICREMKSIMAYFSGRTKDSAYIFPVIKSSSKSARLQYESALRIQNHRLKKLGLSTGRITGLTTHASRHSWATIAKNVNVEISIISEALGHNSEKTTRIYLDSFHRKLLDKANERIRRAIKKAV